MGIMSFRKGLVKDAGTAVAVGKALLFIPLAKIDETEQTVTGIVTAEVLDKAGEIFHYESSAPYFKAWTANFERVTKGKSKGNVRAMHQPNAVGKVIDLVFDDANKSISATVKIVDKGEWEKVVEGVYTGFSIGGSYVKQWEDSTTKKNYFTADPVEISIVDNPCVPVAHFEATKADGTTETRPFKLYTPTNEEVVAKATELAGEGGNWTDYISAAKTELLTKHGIPDFSKIADEEDKPEKSENEDSDEGMPAEKKKDKACKDDSGSAEDDEIEDETEDDAKDENAAKSAIKQVWLATDGKTFEKKADCVAHELAINDPVAAALAKANAQVDAVEKAEKPYGDVAYALEKDGVSMFPIHDALHIRASWVFANKTAKVTDEERTTALEAIKKAWAEKIGGEPPTVEAMNALSGGKATEAVKALGANDLEKSFWTVGWWCRIIDDVLCASCCVGWDSDDSTLSDAAKNICAALLTFLTDLVAAEVASTMTRLDKTARPAELTGLAKFLATTIDSLPAPVEDDRVEKAVYVKLQDEVSVLKATVETQAGQLSKAVDGITTLTERFTKHMNEPQPRPTLTGKVVNKEGDRLGLDNIPADDKEKLKDLVDKHSPTELAQMMIKLSQQQGFTPAGQVRMK
jgi:hypothetical protein